MTPAPYYQRHRIVVDPLVEMTVRHERLQGGDPGIPGGGLCRSPSYLEDFQDIAGVQLVNAKVHAKVLDHGR